MKNFNEIKNIDDNIIPELLKEVELKDISFAIRYSDDEVKDKFFSNMRKLDSDMIKEDIEFMGDIPEEKNLKAQEAIVAAINKLTKD